MQNLQFFYSNLVTVARLERNPTVKTEIAQKKEIFGESVTYGFLGYPVSQAAYITTFDGLLVPAGEDQEPLIEQCIEIVRKFNNILFKTINNFKTRKKSNSKDRNCPKKRTIWRKCYIWIFRISCKPSSRYYSNGWNDCTCW